MEGQKVEVVEYAGLSALGSQVLEISMARLGLAHFRLQGFAITYTCQPYVRLDRYGDLLNVKDCIASLSLTRKSLWVSNEDSKV
jgi:hypothetical protein